MIRNDREIQRKLRILKHTEEIGHCGGMCRYFGIDRASFYRWKAALEKYDESDLIRRKPIPKNRTPPEIVEKVRLCLLSPLTTVRTFQLRALRLA